MLIDFDVTGYPRATLANGLQYPMAVHAANYAAVRSLTVPQPLLSVAGRTTGGDGGEGHFRYNASSTQTDNDGVYLKAAALAGCYERVGAVKAWKAEWFGVRADGVQVTDGVVTASSTALTSASNLFPTSSPVALFCVVRTPSNPLASGGTVATTIGGTTITGTSTHFLTDIGHTASLVPFYGACYIGGQWLAYSVVANDTSLTLVTPGTANLSGQTMYTETQIAGACTVTGAGALTMPSAAVVSGTGIWVTVASDSTTALQNAINSSFAAGIGELVLPAGLIGLSTNLQFTGKSNLWIHGPNGKKSTLVDLRKASFELPNGTTSTVALLEFTSCSGIVLEGINLDGSVPVLGLNHSTGGVDNGSGARSGIRFDNSPDCAFILCGAGTYGARDEHFVFAGDNPHCLFDRCKTYTNGVGYNINAGLGQSIGARIVSCETGYFGQIEVLSEAIEIIGCVITANPGFPIGGDGCILDARSKMTFADNTIRNVNNSTTGSSMVRVFGASNKPDAVLHITGNKFLDSTPGANVGDGACLTISDCQGTVYVNDNLFDNNTGPGAGSRFIRITGANMASTSRVAIGKNYFRGRAGSNMDTGISVKSDVPAGTVFIVPISVFGESITTKWTTSGSATLGSMANQLTVSSTGTTVVAIATDEVLITANGSVTVTLPDPNLVPGWQLVVKNSTTQAGTTTVGTAAGNIDAAATDTLVGANKCGFYFAMGGNWKIISKF